MFKKINFYWIFFLLLLIATGLLAVEKNPTVQTLSGKIQGHYEKSFNGREFKSFEGVPYAKPPIGLLRFQPPEDFPPWEGVLLAIRPESECLQHSHKPASHQDPIHGSEDCLYLNIHVPVIENSTKLLPVIFYIHSGAFQFGSGHDNRPEYLMDREVAFVTVNYRLGALGFLSTGDEVVPGNMGLKDQSLALRWISENIKYFGGDPGRITLAGLSAGAASVHYHYLTPLSRGLFHGGISLSGTALDCWTQTENSLEKVKKLSDILGCPTNDNKRMIGCLITRPAKSIVQMLKEFMPWLYNPFTPFGPVVEVNSSRPFIDRSPVDIISRGDGADVPWLTSVVSEEGLYPAAEFVTDEKLMLELNDDWSVIAPHLLDFNYTVSVSEHVDISGKIRKHYFGDDKIDKNTGLKLIHLIGDRLYVVDAVKAAWMMANRSLVWFNTYSYRGQYSLSDVFTSSKDNLGVSHSDDNILIIYSRSSRIEKKEDLAVQNILLNIWESFATSGIPDAGAGQWRSVNSTRDFDFLHIAGPDNVTMEANSNLGEKEFWESIDFDENKVTQ